MSQASKPIVSSGFPLTGHVGHSQIGKSLTKLGFRILRTETTTKSRETTV